MFFGRSDWLLNQWIAALFTDTHAVPPSEQRQTLLGCEQNAFPVCRNKQRRNRRKEILQLIKQAVSEIHEEGDEVRFGSVNR